MLVGMPKSRTDLHPRISAIEQIQHSLVTRRGEAKRRIVPPEVVDHEIHARRHERASDFDEPLALDVQVNVHPQVAQSVAQPLEVIASNIGQRIAKEPLQPYADDAV